jgi:transposase-like protein
MFKKMAPDLASKSFQGAISRGQHIELLSPPREVEVEMELSRIKKENATLKMKNEILKKAAAYFARESLPGTR